MSQHKTQIKDFVNFTGASDRQAQRYLAQAKWNMQNAINLYYDDGGVPEVTKIDTLPQIQNFFKQFSVSKEKQDVRFIDQQGLQKLFQILKVDLANPVIGHLMINIMKMQTAGQVTKQNIYNLLKYCRVDSFSGVANKMPQLEKQLKDTPHLFKQLYDGLFNFYSMTQIPTLDFATAQQLWGVYLDGRMKWHKEFVQYLQQLKQKPVKVHRDLWKMTYHFSHNINDLSNYKDEDGWPVFLDGFVQYLKQKHNN